MGIRIGRILAIGIPLGIVCGVLKSFFQISNEEFWKYYIDIGIAVIIFSVLINIAYQVRFSKKLNALINDFLKDGDADHFISENQKLLAKTKMKFHRALIFINLSAGYSDKEDFITAKQMLLQVSEKHLRGINKIVYYISLSYIHFRLFEIQEALDLMRLWDKQLCDLQEHQKLGGHIAILKIFELIYTDQLEQARFLLSTSKEKWTDSRLKTAWDYQQKLIDGGK